MKAMIPNSPAISAVNSMPAAQPRKVRAKIRSSLKPLPSIGSTPSMKKPSLPLLSLRQKKQPTA